jgi:hypothetical protein
MKVSLGCYEQGKRHPFSAQQGACPPADRPLQRTAMQEKVKGKKLINCTFLYPFLNETIAIK